MTIEECIAECERIMTACGLLQQTEAYKYNKQLADWLKELLTWRQFGENMGCILVKYLSEEQLKELFEGDENENNQRET